MTEYAYFVVGMTHRHITDRERNAQECSPGGCDRGMAPAGSSTGFREWRKVGTPPELQLCGAVVFSTENDAEAWLKSPAGQQFASRFDYTIIATSVSKP